MTKLTITTSIELSLKKKAEIEKRLAKKYGEIEVVYRINESIIGGIIMFDGKIAYDGSIKTQLDKIKNNLISSLDDSEKD